MQSPTLSSRIAPMRYDNNRCGYCKKSSGSKCYYASTTALTVEFYQKLLDRGWRRSGNLLYKPDLAASCCPQYTIRLDAFSYRSSKNQRQTLNRFNKYIIGQAYATTAARLYPRSREEAKQRKQNFDLLQRVHESEKSNLRSPPKPAHLFSVTIESNDFTEEKYKVFENYQRVVHHEPPNKISRKGFKNFLCTSPLTSRKSESNGSEKLLGSYHQCYRIDGKLIAIGVLDLLPNCVSAVYFAYDESVHQHNFGKLGALREIALAKKCGYRYWYAGFYIHTCVKMRYKGKFAPQYILDPESFGWDLLDKDVRRQLDLKKYLSLSEERTKAVTEGAQIVTLAPSTTSDVTVEAENTVDSTLSHLNDDDFDNEMQEQESPLSLFARRMPGILTKEELMSNVDIEGLLIQVGDIVIEASHLVGIDSNDIDNPCSIKGALAELAAAVGPELAGEMIVQLD